MEVLAHFPDGYCPEDKDLLERPEEGGLHGVVALVKQGTREAAHTVEGAVHHAADAAHHAADVADHAAHELAGGVRSRVAGIRSPMHTARVAPAPDTAPAPSAPEWKGSTEGAIE